MKTNDNIARSRSAFAEYFPRIMAQIERGRTVESSLILENDEPTDIRVNGQLIYGGDARSFAAKQVDSFISKPLRFFVQRLDLSGCVTATGRRLIDEIEKGLRDDQFGECLTRPTKNPTFLIVFGLGLGYHLDELVRRTEAQWLILLEPLVEFFEPSFHVVDWQELTAALEDKGGGIYVITETDPSRMISAITSFISAKGIPYADGSWVFTHYPFWAFTEARNKLHEAVEFNFINRGFYEDELVMMRNAVENFATHDFWLLEDRPHLRRPETAVVVGAGPSLDESIETLRRIRDQVVLFSAGTALRPLLRNGIVPDFHCELENGAVVHDLLVETAKYGDLSKVTLLASATVDPKLPSLFGKTIFYFRDSVSSTQILGRKHREIYGTSPTCVNLATVAAAILGFTDLVFFGTDCGTRPGKARHAKGTIYSDLNEYSSGNEANHAMEVEGNFGGVVYSEIVYDACRLMLIDTVRHFRLSAQNCSDGALIPGARPCVPEALDLGNPPVDRAALMAALDRAMTRYAAGEVLIEADIDAIRGQAEQLFADLDKLLAEMAEGEPDFAAAYDRMMAFVHEAKDRYRYTDTIICGTLQALPRVAMFYGFRLVDDEGRKSLFDLFIAQFRTIATDMADNISALFDRLAVHTPSPERLAANGGS